MSVMFRGKPACECLAEWLPVFEAELIRRAVIRESLDIAQLNGNAPASAGTHKGGAFDVWQHDPVTQEVGREMGAATWNRVTGSFANNRHSHGVLNGCPHNGAARYQIDALAAGFNGLGGGGRGGHDTGPGPRRLRTWREGIAWAQQRAHRRPANRLRVATYNLGDGPDAAKAGDLDRLASVADVICLQEASDRLDVLRAWAKVHGWTLWAGDGSPGAGAVPILAAPGIEVTKRTTSQAVPATNVGNPGAGPSTVKRKVVNGVRLRVDGRRFWVLNTHLTASATRPRLSNARVRRSHYARHVAAILRVVRRRPVGAVAVTMDANAELGFPLLGPLAKVMAAVTATSHGKRAIDMVWLRKRRRPWVRVRSVKALTGYSSDHRPVVVDYALTPRKEK